MLKKPIERALAELRGTVKTIALTQALMDAFVVLALSFLGFILVGIKWYWSLLPFLLYLALHLHTTLKAVNFVNIEERVPILYEQLRTAADTVREDNEVVAQLREDVLRNMRQVRNSYFIRFGKLTTRMLTLVITSFLIIFASATNVRLIDAKDVWFKLTTSQERLPFEVNESLLQMNETEEGDIWGNASIAELGYEQLNLEINPLDSEIDISDVRPPEQQEFQAYAPPEVGAARQGGLAYEESAVVKNNLKIVKNYFAGIARG